MDSKILAQLTGEAEFFKALAHPSRLFVVKKKLADGEQCVCKLTDMIGADKSTVSKHLRILKDAGIISDRKEGTLVYYSLQTPCVLNFMGCIEKILNKRMKELSELYC